jgi:Lipid A 3-O-deacylase (PagL)
MRRLIFLLLLSLSASAQTFDRIAGYATGGQSLKTWHGQATIESLSIEGTRALSPRTELAFVFAPMHVNQPRSWFGDQFGDGDENVRAISAALLLRRTFRDGSLYVEAGTGPMWAERRVPAATSRFNFHSQFGAGLVLWPRKRASMIVGYRFGHISNGGYAPRNPGLNVSSIVIGTRVRTSR